MKSTTSEKQTNRFWLAGGVASALTAVVGLVLLQLPLSSGLTRLSYDLPFALRSDVPVTNVAIVYLDESSHSELHQPLTAPWDRSLHARLVEQLTAQGAKAIVFDILFTEPSDNPSADERFAQAIKQSKRVILAGNYQQKETTPGAIGRWEELPYEPFRTNAAGWGNANLVADPDYGIRRFFTTVTHVSGMRIVRLLSAATAEFVGVPQTQLEPDGMENRWLNYYGPPGTIPAISYFLALHPDGPPPEFFKNKIVFVGSWLSADFSGKGKDEFATPYGLRGAAFASGVEIHAISTLNFLRGDWLVRLPGPVEVALLFLTAVGAGFGMMHLQPLKATLAAFAGSLGIMAGAYLLVCFGSTWFAWVIELIEIGIAFGFSIVSNSVRLYVEKRLAEQARLNYEAMLAELNKAADYVRSLLPPRLHGHAETDWCFHPCEQLGGDAFGYHWVDDDHLAVYLLDVCGHGVGAALLSVSVLNAIRAQNLPGVDFCDPGAVLAALNRSFRMENQNNLFFSAWYGVYRRQSRELVYSSGGHPPALLLSLDADENSATVPLRVDAPAIGCFDEAVYRNEIRSVNPGSRLLVFSDGVYEIFQDDAKTGTWDEFLATFRTREVRIMRPDERLANAKRIRGQNLLEDDFSLVELRFN